MAKLSDPGHKTKRQGAVYEGREVYVSNVDWGASEDDLKEIFGKYGAVERVRIPRAKDGKSKGMAFVVFGAKVSSPKLLFPFAITTLTFLQEDAHSSLDLDKTKLMSRLLHVEMSSTNPRKQ